MRIAKLSSLVWQFQHRYFGYFRYFGALGVALVASIAVAQTLAIDKVLVIVNEEAITLSEYQTRHQREALQQSLDIKPFTGNIDQRLLNRMIDERIQSQTAVRSRISISPAEIDRAIHFIAQKNNITSQQLLDRIQQRGISIEQFRASIKEQQLIRRLLEIAVNSRVVISEQEVDDYLTRHPELLDSDEAYEVSHLSVSLKDKSASEVQSEYGNLEHIRQSLLDGRDFAKSAQQYSDSSDREQGGYLGWRKFEQLPQIFVQELRQTETGQISQILKSDNALHLLKLHARRNSKMVDQQLVRHILIRPSTDLVEAKAAELASQLRQRIIAGEDFQKIAKAYSDDLSTAINGGQLGWVSPSNLPPKFEQVTRALQLGEVSEPLRLESGYHIIQVLERRRHDINQDLATDRARQIIFRRKAEEFYNNWFGPLRDASYIEYVSVNPDEVP